jgi:hypothetical protein
MEFVIENIIWSPNLKDGLELRLISVEHSLMSGFFAQSFRTVHTKPCPDHLVLAQFRF